MNPQGDIPRIKRQIITFGARIKQTLRDGVWMRDKDQETVDQKVNRWVSQTGNVIINITPAFNDVPAGDGVMFTDYLYVVVYESQEDYLRNRQLVAPKDIAEVPPVAETKPVELPKKWLPGKTENAPAPAVSLPPEADEFTGLNTRL